MSIKRTTISKKVRFEVFKRDRFRCVYCGAQSPETILHIDHVIPVVDGGSNAMTNLVAACQACNAGKGRRPLDSTAVADKMRAELEAMAQRREQAELISRWHKELDDAQERELKTVCAYWDEKTFPSRKRCLSPYGIAIVRKAVSRFGVAPTLAAMKIAIAQYIKHDANGDATQESHSRALDKIGGICWNRSKGIDGMGRPCDVA